MRTSGSAQFDALRAHLLNHPTVRKEMENAFAFLLARANPSDRGSRFVVGGTVEWIIAAAAWSAGILTNPAGHGANGFDLTDLLNQSKGLWSVKFSSQKSPGDWRLTNGIGGAGKGFAEPTVFVHRKLGGLVFIDPAQEPNVARLAVTKPDAVVIPFKAILEFAETHPQNVATVDVPINEGQATSNPHAFAIELLSPSHFPNLSKVFSDATPVAASVADEIKKIVALRDAGVISDDERAAAIAKLLRP